MVERGPKRTTVSAALTIAATPSLTRSGAFEKGFSRAAIRSASRSRSCALSASAAARSSAGRTGSSAASATRCGADRSGVGAVKRRCASGAGMRQSASSSLPTLGSGAVPQLTSNATGGQDGQNPDPRLSFLASVTTGLPRDRLLSTLEYDPSPYELHAGSVIPATLLTGINADLPGMIVAQVRDDVFDSVTGRYLLIPRGTKLVGAYDSRIVQGQRRVLVAWTRLLYPDGSSLDLPGMAGTDPSGYAGFSANVDEHLNKTFNSALLLSIISAGAQLSQSQRSVNVNAVPDIGQTIAGAIGQQIGNTSIQLAQRQLQIAPTLEVPSGYVFDVLVDRDIVLGKPYADANAL